MQSASVAQGSGTIRSPPPLWGVDSVATVASARGRGSLACRVSNSRCRAGSGWFETYSAALLDLRERIGGMVTEWVEGVMRVVLLLWRLGSFIIHVHILIFQRFAGDRLPNYIPRSLSVCSVDLDNVFYIMQTLLNGCYIFRHDREFVFVWKS